MANDIKPAPPRTALLTQTGTNKAVRVDGTQDFLFHPTKDLKVTVKRECQPDFVFPNSNEISVHFSGQWPKDIPPPPPPPPGTLVYDLSFVDTNSVNYRDMLGQAGRDDADAITLIRAFRLS